MWLELHLSQTFIVLAMFCAGLWLNQLQFVPHTLDIGIEQTSLLLFSSKWLPFKLTESLDHAVLDAFEEWVSSITD